MSRNTVQMLIGIFVVIMPFLGFPSGFKTFVFVLLGLYLFMDAFARYMRKRSQMINGK